MINYVSKNFDACYTSATRPSGIPRKLLVVVVWLGILFRRLDFDGVDFKPASGVIIQGQQTLYSFWCTMSAQATNLSARVRFTAESDCNLRICRLHIGLYQELKGFSSSPKFFDRLIYRWVQYFCIDYKPAKYALTRICVGLPPLKTPNSSLTLLEISKIELL